MDPAMTLEIVTPDQAAYYLSKSKGNRTLRPGTVMKYARDIETGRWAVNGDTLKFNGNGRLWDGHHRLAACVRAGRPFQTWVVRNLDAAAFVTIDAGTPRNLGDVLKFEGEKDVSLLASTIQFCWRYDRRSIMATNESRMSIQEGLAYLEKHPDLREAVSPARQAAERIRLARSVLASGYFLTARIDQEDAAEFYRLLITWANLPENSPIQTLRKWVDKWIIRTPGRQSQYVQAAILFKALNAWRAGETPQHLRWQRGGSRQEPFPYLLEKIAGTDDD